MTQYQRMGDWLAARGVLTPERLDQAIRAQRQSKARLGEILTSMGLATEAQVLECLSSQYELPIVNLAQVEPQEDAMQIIPSSFAASGLVLPVSLTETELHCVVSDPIDVRMSDEVMRIARRRMVMSLATPTDLYQAILKHYALLAAPRIAIGEEPVKKRKRRLDPMKERRQLLLILSQPQEETLWQKFGGR